MNFNELEKRIGYKFKNTELLKEALTHPSLANELIQKNIPTRSNQRLEFLGDAVLEIVVATHIFKDFTDVQEGKLSSLCSTIVKGAALSSYAKRINLGSYILFGNGQSRDGNTNDKILEDAFEALLGAIYLDCDCSVDEVTKFLMPFLSEKVKAMRSGAETTIDPKSRLQQIIQETPGEKLDYELVSKTGPDNAPTYTVKALLNSNVIGTGVAGSIKQAEQNAAREALKTFFNEIIPL